VRSKKITISFILFKTIEGIEGKREQEGAKPPKIETFVTSA